MSFINEKTKEVNCKVVYYGAPRCGKSTSLKSICKQVKKNSKGELISLNQDDDRTLFFDFVPLTLGKYKNYSMRLHLYTVPGEMGYSQARSLTSKGVDGVVFVVDSQLDRMEANIQALQSLREILAKEGHDLSTVPLVFQYNKRDVQNALPVEEMRAVLSQSVQAEGLESVATENMGTFEVLEKIAGKVLRSLKEKHE